MNFLHTCTVKFPLIYTYGHSITFHGEAPAEGVAQYTLKRFTTSVGAKATEYQGPPSPTLDRLWSDLHLTAMTIPKDQAIKLPNKTSAVSADPDAQYIVGLSVLHDLHCLDNIRHSLNYFYYKQWGNSTLNPGNTPIEELDKDHDKGGIFHVDHMSHCLDMVRQSLMCYADTTPVVWQWSDRAAGIQISLDVVHTCRDFDAVRRWAEEHRYDEPFDNRVPLAEAGHCRELDPNCEN